MNKSEILDINPGLCLVLFSVFCLISCGEGKKSTGAEKRVFDEKSVYAAAGRGSRATTFHSVDPGMLIGRIHEIQSKSQITDNEGAELKEKLKDLAKLSPQEAFDSLVAIKSEPWMGFDEDILSAIAKGLGTEKLIQALEQVPRSNVRLNELYRAMGGLLGKNPTLSESEFGFLKKASAAGKVGESLLYSYFASAVKISAESAKDVLNRLDLDGHQKMQAIGQIAEQLAQKNPKEGIDYLRQNSGDGIGVNSIGSANLTSIVIEWIGNDPTKAWDYLKSLPANEVASMIGTVHGFSRALTDSDPSSTLELIGRLPATASNAKIVEEVLLEVAKTDPDQSLKALNSLPPSNGRDSILKKVFGSLAMLDPDTALDKVSTLSSSDAVIARRSIVAVVAGDDLDKALQMVNDADSTQRKDLLREAARTSALRNPVDAVRILTDPVISADLGDEFRASMVDHTVRTWAHQDRGAATAWVEKLPEQDLPNGVRGLMTSWMQNDPVAASSWLSKMTPSAARDAGALVIISQTKNTDPEMAAQWRNSLSPAPQK